MTWESFVDTTLDTALLSGILITALFSMFRIGLWFQGLVGSMDSLRVTVDRHIKDEEKKFSAFGKKLDEHGHQVSELRTEISKLEHICSRGG